MSYTFETVAGHTSDPRASKTLPDHLIELDGESWAVWREVCLRGAGFPAAQVRVLAIPHGSAAADRVLNLEEEMERTRQRAISLALSQLESVEGEQHAVLDKAVRKLKKKKLPEPLGDGYECGATVEELRDLRGRLEASRAEYLKAFEDDLGNVSQSILGVVGAQRFREAVAWQNRDALHNCFDALLRTPPTPTSQRSSRQRQREVSIANYLQRYCTKNDTIGFFGPSGWARFVDEGEALTVRPGAGLVTNRQVYFEGWGLDVLAESLSKDKKLHPWIVPRRLPFVQLDGATLRMPFERPAKLPPTFATVLHACDGTRTAKEIAATVIGNNGGSLKSEADVFRLLETLQQKGVIAWALEVPWTLDYPHETRLENNLRRMLDRIGDDALHREAISALDELDAARKEVAAAAGDDAKLDGAIERLSETFERLTGTAATRESGKTYAGRTLVYEDCRRDIEVELGPEILDALAAPLPLLLRSARWFTAEVAKLYRKAFKDVHAELARASGSSAVESVEFWLRAYPLLFDDKQRLVDTVLPQFQQRWADVLALPSGTRRVEYNCEQLRGLVDAAFDAERPGWPYARYHSPDLMLAAASVEAARCGEYQLVLGELHIGLNTLGASYFVGQHPTPEKLFNALDIDVPEIRLVTVTPKAMVTGRNHPIFVTPKDLRIEFTRDPSNVPREKSLPIGETLIDETADGLVLRTRDGRLSFDIIDAFADVLSGLSANSFKLLRPAAHTPRVSFERLIVCRETWRFAPAEMTFAFEKDEAERFVAARRWARAQSIPRFVFTKSPAETKPVFIDFDSPALLDVFSKMVRQYAESGETALVGLTEMIPSLDEIWLPDAEGQRYTSEFRIVALDLSR